MATGVCGRESRPRRRRPRRGDFLTFVGEVKFPQHAIKGAGLKVFLGEPSFFEGGHGEQVVATPVRFTPVPFKELFPIEEFHDEIHLFSSQPARGRKLYY